MNHSIDTSIKAAHKLPMLKIVTGRSTSAKLCNDPILSESVIEDSTPYFRHHRNQSNSIDSYQDSDLSVICMKILQEQNELKQKIHQQAKLIQNIYRRRPPVPAQIKNMACFMDRENREVTFKQNDWPQSAKDVKRFKFPREVFTRKVTSRLG